MHKKLMIIASCIVSIGILAYVLFEISSSRTFQFFGELTARVETEQKIVALTFDDAPTEYSDAVVDILQEHAIKGTFYMIGQNIEKDPSRAKNIANADMEIGNHSYTHPRFYLKSQSDIDNEIQKTNELIRSTGYKDAITFRPPYGKKLFGLPYYLNQKGIHTIMWDVEPDSFIDKNLSGKERTDFIVRYTLENTKPGSIILLHPFCKTCESDRNAVKGIIIGLQDKGYKFVTVSELLQHK